MSWATDTPQPAVDPLAASVSRWRPLVLLAVSHVAASLSVLLLSPRTEPGGGLLYLLLLAPIHGTQAYLCAAWAVFGPGHVLVRAAQAWLVLVFLKFLPLAVSDHEGLQDLRIQEMAATVPFAVAAAWFLVVRSFFRWQIVPLTDAGSNDRRQFRIRDMLLLTASVAITTATTAPALRREWAAPLVFVEGGLIYLVIALIVSPLILPIIRAALVAQPEPCVNAAFLAFCISIALPLGLVLLLASLSQSPGEMFLVPFTVAPVFMGTVLFSCVLVREAGYRLETRHAPLVSANEATGGESLLPVDQRVEGE